MEKRLNELEKELISKKLGKASCSMPRERTIKTKQIYTVLKKVQAGPWKNLLIIKVNKTSVKAVTPFP